MNRVAMRGGDPGKVSFEIQAESPEDARLRVSRLAFASYDGELVAKIPASLGVPAKAIIALRNSTHGLRRLLGW